MLLEMHYQLVLWDQLVRDLASQLLQLLIELNDLPMKTIAVLESLSCLLQLLLCRLSPLLLGRELSLYLPDTLYWVLDHALLQFLHNPCCFNAEAESIGLIGFVGHLRAGTTSLAETGGIRAVDSL